MVKHIESNKLIHIDPESLEGIRNRVQHFLTIKSGSDILAKHMNVIGISQENDIALYRRYIDQPGKGKILFSLIYRISSIFPTINLRWLLHNQGESELPQTGFVITEEGILMTTENKPSFEMPVVIRNMKDKEQINIVPAHLIKEYAIQCNNPEFVVKLPFSSNFIHSNEIFRDFEVKGDSLKPKIFEKDIIRGKFIAKSKYFALPLNEIVVIVSKLDIYFRTIVSNRNNELVLRSVNRLEDDISINIDDINEIWLFSKLITDRNPLL